VHFSHSTAFAFPPAADDSHTDDISAEHSGNIPDERREAIREWREVMGALRGSPEDATLFSLYHDPRDNDFVNDAGFDGAYSYFASDGFTRGSSSSLWSLSSRHLAEHGKAFVPSVGPGYDDTAIRPWNVQNTKSRQDGHYYDQMWKAALEISPPHITITSYNEWGEGEPFFFPAASSSRALALVSPRSWAPFFGPVLWPRFQTRLRFQTPTLLLRMQAHRLSRLRPFSLYILFFLRMQAHRLSRLSPSLYTFFFFAHAGTQIEPAKPFSLHIQNASTMPEEGQKEGRTYKDYSPGSPDFYMRRTAEWVAKARSGCERGAQEGVPKDEV